MLRGHPLRPRWLHLAAAPLLALLAAFPPPALAGAPSLEGNWRLVEQHYGEGKGNLADASAPLRLELRSVAGRLSGTLHAGGKEAAALPWPSFLTEEGPAAVEVLDAPLEAAGGVAQVRYRTRPSPADGLVLEIVERYEISPDGKELSGTLTARFRMEGKDRGGFTLHRRFEREP